MKRVGVRLGSLLGVLTALVLLTVGAGPASAKPAHPADPAQPAKATAARQQSGKSVGTATVPGRQKTAAQGLSAVLGDLLTPANQTTVHAATALGTTAAQVTNAATGKAKGQNNGKGKSAPGKAKGQGNGQNDGKAEGHAKGQGNGPATNRSTAVPRPASVQPGAAFRAATPGARTASLNGPTLVAGHSARPPTMHTAPVHTVPDLPRVEAFAPTTLLTAPGTGVLVGTLFGFAVAVCAMVYGAGRRTSRAR